MLHESGLIEVELTPEADLRLRRSPLIDLYLESFITEVERLNHAGLAKKYRLRESNLNKVKGRILFSQHLRRNLFHQERMFTAHQTYDRDNVFNQILKRALDIIKDLAVQPSISSRATLLGLAFENVSDVRVTANTFILLQLNRNIQRYYRALQLARLIILNYAPDLRGGDNNVVAILFEMNELFERFILANLHRAQDKFIGKKIVVHVQLSKNFWGHKSIRPDVMIKAQSEQGIEQFIVDTKWKIPASNLPSDEDLKQIYVYNLQFGSARGLLVYPRADADQIEIRNSYAGALSSSVSHSCETCFVDLFGPDRKIRNDIGSQMLAHIMTSVA
jgi:5-methylcytosine-specific restriction enzyme subunit McrC